MSTTITLGQDYLPLHHKKKGYTLSIPFSKVAWVTVSLPLTSFIFCVIWSILFNFERSTYTHCQWLRVTLPFCLLSPPSSPLPNKGSNLQKLVLKAILIVFVWVCQQYWIEVKNYLPSISAAIGVFTPQRYVWRTAIAVHALPRMLVAKMYHRYYQSILYPGIQFLAGIACWLNVLENLALIGLTFISSAENYAVHEKCFITFMVTSELYMLLTCYLLRKFRRFPPDNVESKSLKTKHQLLVINLTSFAMAGYFFKRHNWYCEPGVYSIFAFFEYVVVLTNMAFHMTAFWDFHERSLEVGPLGFGHS